MAWICPVCKTVNNDDSLIRCGCGHHRKTTKKQKTVTQQTIAIVDGPAGLGGWLILIAISLFSTLSRTINVLVRDFLPLFQQGFLDLRLTQIPESQHSLLQLLIFSEIAAAVIIILFDGILIFLFFTRSYRFPILFIIFIVMKLLVTIADFMVTNLFFDTASMINSGAVNQILPGILASIFLVTYILVSKRVKNTFLRSKQKQVLLSYQPPQKTAGEIVDKRWRWFYALFFTYIILISFQMYKLSENPTGKTRESAFNQTFAPITSTNTDARENLFIKIIAPNGGETLKVGELYTIKWSASDHIEAISLAWSKGPGKISWIATGIPANGSGSYSWKVNLGTTSQTEFKIKIIGYMSGQGSASDESDGFFQITGKKLSQSLLTGFNTTMQNVKPKPTEKLGRVIDKQVDITKGLVLSYSFDDDNGNVVIDESGNGNNGLVKGPTHITDRDFCLGAYEFDGSNRKIVISDSPDLRLQTLTVSAWVRPGINMNDGVQRVIVSKEKSGAPGGYYLAYTKYKDEAGLNFKIMSNKGRGYHNTFYPFHLVAGRCYHIVGTYDGESRRLYIDGKLVKSIAEKIILHHDSQKLFIGAQAPGRGAFWNGTIDEVNIFNRAMNENEIAILYEKCRCEQ